MISLHFLKRKAQKGYHQEARPISKQVELLRQESNGHSSGHSSVFTEPGQIAWMQKDGQVLAIILVQPFKAAFETLYAELQGGHPLVSSRPSLKSFRNSLKMLSIFSTVRLSASLSTSLAHPFGKNCNEHEDKHHISYT